MKNKIFYVASALLLGSYIFSSCQGHDDVLCNQSNKQDIDMAKLAQIDPSGYAKSTPDNLMVNPHESWADSISAVGILVKEGHSHAPESSRSLIGGVMWSTNFSEGNRNFHGNPFNSDSKIPYRREQYILYKKMVNGGYELDSKYTETYNKQNIFDLQSATPRDHYLRGVMFALVVQLYNKKYANPRIDQLFKMEDSSRLQVFYKVKNVRPLRPKDHVLPDTLKKTDVCYYWYYDRLPKYYKEYNRYYDEGNYFQNNAIGFRGVIQALQPYTQFDLQMSVCLLPKGMKKEKTMQNSITPTPIQARHVVFQFTIPMRTITSYPDYSNYAFNKMGMDYTNPKFDDKLYEKYIEEAENTHFSDLKFIYPAFSIDSLKKLDQQQKLLMGESSDFAL